MTKGRKFLRGLTRFVLGIFALIMLVFALLQLPVAQRFLARKVVNIASQQLNTDLGLEKLRLRFFDGIDVEGFYLNNPDGDTIARVGRLSADVYLLGLIKSRIALTNIELRNAYVNIVNTDTTSNIAFLTQSVTDTVTTSPPADTTQSRANWEIILDGTLVDLTNTEVYFQDDPSGILVDMRLAALRGKTNAIDLESGTYDIDRLDAENLRGRYRQFSVADTTTSDPVPLNLSVGRFGLSEVDADIDIDSLSMRVIIPLANLENGTLELTPELDFRTENFLLRDGGFRLDGPGPPMTTPGIDYAHLQLDSITAEVTDIAYVVDSLYLNLRQLTAEEKSGLTLERAEGEITYTPDLLALENFLLRTPNTRISSSSTRVNYGFADNAPPETLSARFGVEGSVSLRDVAYLAPDFRDIPIVADNLSQRVEFTARANGNGRAVDIDRLTLRGPGISLDGTGQVDYPFDTARLAATFQINELDVRPSPILPLLPDTLLPRNIDWPRRLVAEGRLTYGDDAVRLDLYALEERDNPLNLSSKIRASGSFAGLTTYPRSTVNLRADTLFATRTTLLAYLPEKFLPPGYRLPDYVRGSGRVEGPLNGTLDVDLQLYLPGESTFASLEGTVSQVLDPEQTELNLNLRDLSVASADVLSLIPDTLLPENFNLPEFRVRNARVSGRLKDLDFELPLETSNGNWNLKGKYDPEDLRIEAQLENFVLSELFTGSYRDTLETLGLQPLDLQATVIGRLEPTPNLQIELSAQEEERGQILDLVALVDGNTYSGDFLLTHPDFMAEGSGLYSLREDSTVILFADVDLDRVDLERWDITEVPLFLSGHLVADVDGIDPYRMKADIVLDEVLLRGEDGSSYVDSLVVDASLLDEDNEIYVRSDVINAELTGRFDPLAVTDEFVRFLRGYWEEGIRQPDPLVNGKSVNFKLEVKRTLPLTSGLINGLTDLEPFVATAAYRDANPGLVLDVNLPRIVYGGLTIDELIVKGEGDVDRLDFQADFADVAFSEQFELGRTRITGSNLEDGMLTELKVWTKEDSLRHHLSLTLDPETDTTTVKLSEEQIINFQPWRVPTNNLIALAGPKLLVRDFALAYEDQRLAAQSTNPGDVEVTFDNFELTTISRLLNSEKTLLAGTVNGEAELDNVLTNFGLATNLTVSDLAYLETPLGTLEAEVVTPDEKVYRIDADLEGDGNRTYVDGTYVLNGVMDLNLNVEKLQLRSAEPFSLGYLKDTEGFVSGQVQLTGTPFSPRANGSLRFNEAYFRISLLGEKFGLGSEAITFNGRTVRVPGLAVIDSRGGKASLRGNVFINNLEDIRLDLRANANNFLALNSTREDNNLYYGQLAVNADVTIGGTAFLPVLDINASPAGDSEVTYVYTVAQNRGLINSQNVVEGFVDQLEWANVLRNDTIQNDTVQRTATGIDLTLNLAVDPDLLVNVIVDPISGQTFTGRAQGNLTFRQFPDERQEMVGRVELVDGTYDFIFQNVLRRAFTIIPGSNASFNGDILNPQLDLRIRHEVRTSPLPLVTALDPQADNSGLRRRQTFYVRIDLRGDLQAADIQTNIIYPADATGNLGLNSVSDALARLRQDQSRITTTAFSLLAFQSFNVPILDSQGGGVGFQQTTLDRLMGQTLNNLANQYLGFVEVDFGLESYEASDGGTNTNLRLSLSKSLFNDRLIVRVDGVTGTDDDIEAGNGQTYLDNITAEYLIDEEGQFRLKIFNDRDRDVLVGGNVIRFGGRLTFSKEFDRLWWSSKDQK